MILLLQYQATMSVPHVYFLTISGLLTKDAVQFGKRLQTWSVAFIFG